MSIAAGEAAYYGKLEYGHPSRHTSYYQHVFEVRKNGRLIKRFQVTEQPYQPFVVTKEDEQRAQEAAAAAALQASIEKRATNASPGGKDATKKKKKSKTTKKSKTGSRDLEQAQHIEL